MNDLINVVDNAELRAHFHTKGSVTYSMPSHAELQVRSIANFAKLPAVHRERCIKHLRRIFRDSKEALHLWTVQVHKGKLIGSDDPRFHFDLGMQVRNSLRAVVYDLDLPPVEQPGGDYASNWDDYYIGALHAAITEELHNGH